MRSPSSPADLRFIFATINQAHVLSNAKVLQRRGQLERFLVGLPKSNLAKRGLDSSALRTFIVPFGINFLTRKITDSTKVRLKMEPYPKQMFDTWAKSQLVDCDVFLSTSSQTVKAGQAAQKHGALYICDRPCSHILTQSELVTEEYRRHGLTWPGLNPKLIEMEEEDYERCDFIAAPSSFAVRSFVERGISRDKIWQIPYGVDLEKFYPEGEPDPDEFCVVFVGQKVFRKGIPYLVEAFKNLRHPKKKLLLIGSGSPELDMMLGDDRTGIEVIEPVSQDRLRTYFSEADVMVLPSVEEGLALVQAQAMACGCPVIGTTNTGAEDLFEDGKEGFVTPIRDPDAITDRLQLLADNQDLRRNMRALALERTKSFGGLETYIDTLSELSFQAIKARS